MEEGQVGEVDHILSVKVHRNLQIVLGKLGVSALAGADGKLVVDLGVASVQPQALQKVDLCAAVVFQHALCPAADEVGFPSLVVGGDIFVHGLQGIVRTAHHHLVVGIHYLVARGEHPVD